LDTEAPVITIIGGSTVTVNQGATYTDSGATATDNVDGDISANISETSTVNTAVAGTYTVTYSVSDVAGNVATPVVRTVNVTDTEAPVINLNGPTIININQGLTYTDSGATATDNLDGDITANITATSTVDTNRAGSYSVTYDVSDAAGNAATPVVRTVNVLDTEAPVITIIGGSTVSVNQGDTYTDLGAAATDNLDGNISANITATSTVDTTTAGTYTVTYNVTDAAGNAATPVVRTVTVVDTQAPVISITGSNTVSVNQGIAYTDQGATATDNLDGDISANIVATNTVDTTTAGAYTVIYNVSDAAGNAAISKTRTVTVLDTEAPVITINGNTTVSVNQGATYTDLGATATDSEDGNLTNQIVTVSNVNTAVAGAYTVTYDVDDSAGNSASTVVRTVTVLDTEAPVITITGNSTVSVNQDATYTDQGATALDNKDGNITNDITENSTVDTTTAGSYSVTYDVSDAAGNPAIQKTRTVNVLDTEAPIITLLGVNPASVNQGATYTDAGATALDNVDGNITGNINIAGTVNTVTPGTYTITYDVSDAAGNPAIQITRVVNVVDSETPVITLTGANPFSVNQGSAYVEPGATASDSVDGDISADIVINTGTLDTNVAGTYFVTYNVSDAAGNAATTVTREVTVQPLPDQPGAITPPGTDIFQGASAMVFSVAPVQNATSYNWSFPAGATIVSGAGTNTVSVDFSLTAVSGNVSVAGVNNIGTGPSSTAFIYHCHSGPRCICWG
jgi:hypothetical protein